MEYAVKQTESFEDIFGFLEVEGRPLEAVLLLQLANTPLQKCSSSAANHTHDRAMQFCRTADNSLPSVIVLIAGKKPISITQMVPHHDVHNAFHALMASMEQQDCYVNFLSRDDVAGAFSKGTYGVAQSVAQSVTTRLHQSGTGFCLARQIDSKSIFL
jgi:hypothetical protein